MRSDEGGWEDMGEERSGREGKGIWERSEREVREGMGRYGGGKEEDERNRK